MNNMLALLEKLSDKMLIRHGREILNSKFYRSDKYTETVRDILKNDNITPDQRFVLLNHFKRQG